MEIMFKKTDQIEEVEPYNLEEQPYIFISYAHKDKAIAMPLFRRLKNDGYVFWFDSGIDPGTEWADFIAKKVKKCGFFIALMSRNYIESSNCKDELDFSWKYLSYDRRLLIYIEDIDMPEGMELRNGRLHALRKYSFQNSDGFYKELYSEENICQFHYVPYEEGSTSSDFQQTNDVKKTRGRAFLFTVAGLLLFFILAVAIIWRNHSELRKISYGNGIELLCEYNSVENILTANLVLPGKDQETEAWAVLGLWYSLTVFDDYNITIERGEETVSFSAEDFNRDYGGDEKLEPDYNIFPKDLRNYIEENSESFYRNMAIKLFEAIKKDREIFADLGVNDKILNADMKTLTFDVDGESFTIYEQFDGGDCVVNIFLVGDVSERTKFESAFLTLSHYMNKTEGRVNLWLIIELDSDQDGTPEAYGNYANTSYFGSNVFDSDGNGLSLPTWEEIVDDETNDFGDEVFSNFVIMIKDLKVEEE